MVRWQCAAISGALVLSLCSHARAQTSLHATADASAAYSDNAFGVAEGAGEVATFFFMLTPGALLYHDTPRGRYSVSYQRHYAFFVEGSENNSASDTASAELNYALSPIQNLTLGLYLTHSSFAGIIETMVPGADEPRVGYETERLRVDLTESYTHELSVNWRFLQSASFGTMVPIESQDVEPLRYRISAELGAEYTYGHDAYGLLAGVTYFRSASLSDELTTPDQDAILTSLNARWRRDLSLRWSSELSAGIGLAVNPDTVAPDGLVGAALYYSAASPTGESAFNAGVHYHRTQSTSLENFSLSVTDEGGVDFSAPLSQTSALSFSCSTSLAHNRQILQAVDNDASVNVWLSAADVSWVPSWFSLSLRYQYLRQFAASDPAVLPNLDQHLVMLTVAGTFPEQRIQSVSIAAPTRVTPQSPAPATAPATPSQ